MRRFDGQLPHYPVFVLGEHALKYEVQLPWLQVPTLPVGILGPRAPPEEVTYLSISLQKIHVSKRDRTGTFCFV